MQIKLATIARESIYILRAPTLPEMGNTQYSNMSVEKHHLHSVNNQILI